MIDLVPLDRLLSRVIDNRGKTCPTAENGMPLIATNCVKNEGLFPTLERVRYVSDETYRQWFRGHPEPGDLIFVTKGEPGQVCLAPEPVNFCIAQDMVALRADDAAVYPPYLFAALRSRQVQDAIVSMHVGTMIPHFKKGDFDKLLIPRPRRGLQQYIGDMYLLLSRKIDLNRRMNETLKAVARAIFKDWFVDFGPTRAKMDGCAPYLAPEIWALFPDRQDIEGKPEGWTKMTLAELAKQSGGQIRTGPFGSQLHQADYLPTGTPVVMPANLISGEIAEEGIARIGPEMIARLSDHAMTEGDIVYGRRGDIGRKALVGPDEAGWLCGTGCLRISICSTNCPPPYIFCHLDRPEVREWISARAIGATMPNLNTSILGEVEILVPNPEIASKFLITVDPLIQRARMNRRESNSLAATRDLLLPKLMSGEIHVKDAENAVEAVA